MIQKLTKQFSLCAFLLTATVQLISANETAKVVWRTALKEAGQSGICLQGEHLYLTVHAPLTEEPKGSLLQSSDIVGQCFEQSTGELKWEVELPGTHAGPVLESWHDSTSLKPVANESVVVFQNVNGMLMCCGHGGEVKWKRPFKAPEPAIKNSRMFLHGGKLIVALPSEKIAVPAHGKHAALPFYQLHGLDLNDGTSLWVSDVLQGHATQYDLQDWKGQTVIASSISNMGHWNFNQGNRVFLISPEDGKLVHDGSTTPFSSHQRNQLIDGLFLVSIGEKAQPKGQKSRTLIRLIDPASGETSKEITFERPDVFYANDGKGGYKLAEWEPRFDHRYLNKRTVLSPSTIHVFDGRIFYFPFRSPSLACIDVATSKTTMIDVPIQTLMANGAEKQRTVWELHFRRFSYSLAY